jgi:hypothetical protein
MPSSASRLDGRRFRAEESPGSIRMRRRITSGGGDPRESATESKPPDAGRSGPSEGKGERVRQERTAPAATSAARQAPPGAKPNRSDARRLRAARGLFVGPVARVGCSRRSATGVPEEWPSRRGDKPRPYRTRLTGRLAFLSFLVQTRGGSDPTDGAFEPLKGDDAAR